MRGFYLHEYRGRPDFVYIFDRDAALATAGSKRGESKAPDAPDFQAWTAFMKCFTDKYVIDPESFYGEAFRRRQGKEKVEFTWAGALFGISESRLKLGTTLDSLLSKGFIPQPTPKPAAASVPSPPPRQQQSTPARPLNRRSGGATDLRDGLRDTEHSESPSTEAAGIIRTVDELWEASLKLTGDREVAAIGAWEFVLGRALNDEALVAAYTECGERAFYRATSTTSC